MHPDFETLVIDAQDRALTRRIPNCRCDHIVRNGWIARQMPALFRAAQLTEVTVTTDTWQTTHYSIAAQLLRLREHTERAQNAGAVSATEAPSWLRELEQAGNAGQFFAAITFFFVSGRKP